MPNHTTRAALNDRSAIAVFARFLLAKAIVALGGTASGTLAVAVPRRVAFDFATPALWTLGLYNHDHGEAATLRVMRRHRCFAATTALGVRVLTCPT
jgi:hypothetical protein